MTESIRDLDDILYETCQAIPSPPTAPPPPAPQTAGFNSVSLPTAENDSFEKEVLEQLLEDTRAETNRLRHQTTLLTETVNFLSSVMRTSRNKEKVLEQQNRRLVQENGIFIRLVDQSHRYAAAYKDTIDKLQQEVHQLRGFGSVRWG